MPPSPLNEAAWWETEAWRDWGGPRLLSRYGAECGQIIWEHRNHFCAGPVVNRSRPLEWIGLKWGSFVRGGSCWLLTPSKGEPGAHKASREDQSRRLLCHTSASSGPALCLLLSFCWFRSELLPPFPTASLYSSSLWWLLGRCEELWYPGVTVPAPLDICVLSFYCLGQPLRTSDQNSALPLVRRAPLSNTDGRHDSLEKLRIF